MHKRLRSEKALLIVDVQNDFCPGGALFVPDGDKVVDPINKMILHAVKSDWEIFASKDWHPRETSHFKKWPVHCVKNTDGALFHPRLASLDFSIWDNPDIGRAINEVTIIYKGFLPDDEGYSPFDGINDPIGIMRALRLDGILIIMRVKEIYICGLATDYCVKAAALDSIKNGYVTYLLLNACKAKNVNPGDEEKAIQKMKDAGVIMTTVDEVIEQG